MGLSPLCSSFLHRFSPVPDRNAATSRSLANPSRDERHSAVFKFPRSLQAAGKRQIKLVLKMTSNA